MEAPILIDLWTVESDRRDELVRRISEVMRNVVVGQPGFVSSEIYESVDGGVVMSSVHMQTAEDRQHLLDSREAHNAYRELRAIAGTHARLYRLVESFGEAR
jgi:heme-degrading monooxygenase HmoA